MSTHSGTPQGVIVIASDHNGVRLKGLVKKALQNAGKHVIDLGPHTEKAKVDYCDYATELGQIIENGEVQWGVLLCGTGVGMSIVANRFPRVRAALVHSLEVAQKSREHNDANVLCLGAWVNSDEDNLAIVEAWFNSPFGEGRHVPRLEKITPHKSESVVFANGIFDIVHTGHIQLLHFAKSCGGKLVVAINSDDSTRRLKGEGRPLNNEQDRKRVLESLECVDEVVIFDEDSPRNIMLEVHPDVIVKGAEWTAEEVRKRDDIPGDIEVKVFPLVFEEPGKKYSTTSIVERIQGT